MPPSYNPNVNEPERPRMGVVGFVFLAFIVGGTASHIAFREYYKAEVEGVVALQDDLKDQVRAANPKTVEALHKLKTAPVPRVPYTPATADVKPLEVVVTKGSAMDAKIYCKTEPLEHPSGEVSNLTQCVIEHPPEDLTAEDKGFLADLVAAVIAEDRN